MSIDIDTIEPRRCPICDAGVLSKLDSPTGLSHFIKFACGFEMCDQYEARPRGWKPRFGSTCRNIDANSLWALRRAVEQSAEDFNAEAVARLKAESDVRELRAALEPGHKCVGQPVCIVCALRAETSELRAALDEAKRVATGQAFRAEQFKAALERARALVPDELRECVTKPGRGYTECGCKTSAEGDQHCMYCLWPEWIHKLAAALGSGGAA